MHDLRVRIGDILSNRKFKKSNWADYPSKLSFFFEALIEAEHGTTGNIEDYFTISEEGMRLYRKRGDWQSISKTDFYRLMGSMNGLQEGNKKPTDPDLDPFPVYFGLTEHKRKELWNALEYASEVWKPGFFNKIPWAASAFRDGTVVLDSPDEDGSWVVEEPNPKFRCRNYFDFDLIPSIEKFENTPEDMCPEFEDAIEQWFKNESEEERSNIRTCLLEYIGAAIFGLGPMFFKAMFLIGSGANGKSVFMNALTGIRGRFEGIFPASLCSCSPPNSWDTGGVVGLQMRNALVGKLLNVVPEVSGQRFYETVMFKSIIAGDQVNARELNEKNAQHNMMASHIFGVNNIPQGSPDTSEGFYRRQLFLPWKRNFNKDPVPNVRPSHIISGAIAEERQDILVLAINAVRAAYERGKYTLVEASEAILDEFKARNYAVQFAANWRVMNPDTPRRHWLPASSLWANFRREQDFDVINNRDKIGKSEFFGQMKRAFPESYGRHNNQLVFCVEEIGDDFEDMAPRTGTVSSQRSDLFAVK